APSPRPIVCARPTSPFRCTPRYAASEPVARSKAAVTRLCDGRYHVKIESCQCFALGSSAARDKMLRAIIHRLLALAANKLTLGCQLGFSGTPVRFTTRSAPLPLTMRTAGDLGIGAMTGRMGDQHGCAAFWVKGVAEALKAEGLDVAALFDEAG